MSIKFVCSCGKRLRARDDMAARRSACPRCGAPVGIPSLEPTHPGTPALGPMTPEERFRARHQRPPDSPLPEVAERHFTAAPPADPPKAQLLVAPEPLDEDSVQVLRPARRTRPPLSVRVRAEPETRWYQCLGYPCRAALPIFGATLALTCYTALSGYLFPYLFEDFPTTAQRLGPGLCWVVCFLVLLAPVSEFLNDALVSAAAGIGAFVIWPSVAVKPILKASATWMACFLAGPILPAALAIWYGFWCGDPTLVDWVIVAELLAVAVCYWVLALLAVARANRLFAATPLRVAELLGRLGPRVLVGAGLAGAFLVADVRLLLGSLTELHRDGVTGVLGIGFAWGALLFGAAFFFRLVGMWAYRSDLTAEDRADTASHTPPLP